MHEGVHEARLCTCTYKTGWCVYQCIQAKRPRIYERATSEFMRPWYMCAYEGYYVPMCVYAEKGVYRTRLQFFGTRLRLYTRRGCVGVSTRLHGCFRGKLSFFLSFFGFYVSVRPLYKP
jgi:hypothetical protein